MKWLGCRPYKREHEKVHEDDEDGGYSMTQGSEDRKIVGADPEN